jgi:DNA-binding IclR family transcriptional regulator
MESTVLVKAFVLLEALSGEDEPVKLAALCERVEMAKPTVHRLMGHLIALGYVERVGTGRYRLTDKLRALGAGESARTLLDAAEPILADLHNKTGETVNLGELSGDNVVYLRVLESPHPLRRVIRAGEKHQALSTALGRAIIAHHSKREQERLFNRITVTAQTTETVVDTATLRSLIARVRDAGYAFERDENELGVTCFGAPVFRGSQVIAAISLSVPTARLDLTNEAGFIRATRQAAEKLSNALD